jgi:hypothetical protein
MNTNWRHPGGVLLVAALNDKADTFEDDGLPRSWHVDAALAAMARAAVRRGLQVLMPPDQRFVPLVADVLAEYAKPRMAEGEIPAWADGPMVSDRAALVLVALGSGIRPKLTPSLTAAMRPLIQLGIMGTSVLPIADQHVRATFVFGGGAAVDRALRGPTTEGVPKYHFVRATGVRRAGRTYYESVTDSLDADLIRAKGEIQFVVPRRRDGHVERVEAGPPPDFWRFPAYPLYAEFLLEKLL